MTEQAPNAQPELSPFFGHTVATEMPFFWKHASADLQFVMVRLRQDDAQATRSFTAALQSCQQTLEPQRYYRSINQSADLYQVCSAPADAGDEHVDIWTTCHVSDLPMYRHAMFDAKDELASLNRVWWQTKGAAIAAAAVGALTLPFILQHATQDQALDQATPAAQPVAISPQNVLHKAKHRPNHRRLPSVTPTSPQPSVVAPPHHPQSKPHHANAPVPQATPENPIVPPANKAAFSIVTFNALGASHTDNRRGKDYGKMPKSKERSRLAAEFILNNHFGVVGLQEFQRPQRSVLMNSVGQRYDIFPSQADYHQHASENSIIWDQGRFSLQDSGYRSTHYFDGNEAKMPWVLLYDKLTGKSQYVLNTHDPADTRQFSHQAKWREIDAHIHLSDVERFSKNGTPTYLVGDFNSANTIRPADQYLFGNDWTRLTPCILTASGLLAEVEDVVRGRSTCPGNSKSIDHIFVTNNVGVAQVEHLNAQAMTDHGRVEVAWVESAPDSAG